MAKKSVAQIRRMELRAAARGGEYVPPPPPVVTEEEKKAAAEKVNEKEKASAETAADAAPTKIDKMIEAAQKLKKELVVIQTDEGLRAKERRSHKRKAEAIAAEAAGCTVEEMQKWYEENQDLLDELEKKAASSIKKGKAEKEEKKLKRAPLIVFVGQLSYDTKREALFEHIKKELGSEHKINQETVKVRLLTDAKTKVSRGMAFVELGDPELMYACLKLHKSLLEGRRINVERSAGGRNTEVRKEKIKQFREKQEEYLSSVVETILADFIKSGELQEGELDAGAIALCKRHTTTMVEAAIKEYIESDGRTMDNPSAYFSFLLGKLADDKEQGYFNPGGDENKGKQQKPSFPPKKKPRTDAPKSNTSKTVASKSSLPGVDFSISEDKSDANSNPLSKMFPAMARGRGRGRGYM